MSNATNFFQTMLSKAQRASNALGMPVSVILAQWGVESAYGTSKLATKRNNLGGISWGGKTVPAWSKAIGLTPRPKEEGGNYLVYASVDDYVTDYITVMSNSRYDNVRAAGKTETLQDDFKALGASGYAASGYGQGGTIQKVLEQFNLTKYDKKKLEACPTCKRPY